MRFVWKSEFDVRVDGVRVSAGDEFEPSAEWLKRFGRHAEAGNMEEVKQPAPKAAEKKSSKTEVTDEAR